MRTKRKQENDKQKNGNNCANERARVSVFVCVCVLCKCNYNWSVHCITIDVNNSMLTMRTHWTIVLSISVVFSTKAWAEGSTDAKNGRALSVCFQYHGQMNIIMIKKLQTNKKQNKARLQLELFEKKNDKNKVMLECWLFRINVRGLIGLVFVHQATM